MYKDNHLIKPQNPKQAYYSNIYYINDIKANKKALTLFKLSFCSLSVLLGLLYTEYKEIMRQQCDTFKAIEVLLGLKMYLKLIACSHCSLS